MCIVSIARVTSTQDPARRPDDEDIDEDAGRQAGRHQAGGETRPDAALPRLQDEGGGEHAGDDDGVDEHDPTDQGTRHARRLRRVAGRRHPEGRSRGCASSNENSAHWPGSERALIRPLCSCMIRHDV